MAAFNILVVYSCFILGLVVAQDYCSKSNRCGKECCQDDERCQYNTTCVKGRKIFCSDGISYCLEPTKCCGVMTCCPSDSDCCGYNTCCPKGAVCCGISTCCPPGSTCCGFSNCCGKGSSCKAGICRSHSIYSSAGYSWYYLFAVLLPLAAIIAMFNYRRRRRQMLLRAEALANRSHGGRVIEPARYEYPSSTPILSTNAGYDQPPPAYDVVAAQTAPGEPVPQAGLPSYYDLYKEEDVKTDEAVILGNTSEETYSPEAQESSAANNRNDTQNSSQSS